MTLANKSISSMDSALAQRLETERSSRKSKDLISKEMAQALIKLTSEIASMKAEAITSHYGTNDVDNRNIGINLSIAVDRIAKGFDAAKAMLKSPSRDSDFQSSDLDKDTLEATLNWQRGKELGTLTGYENKLTELTLKMFDDAMSLLTQVLYPRSQRLGDELAQNLKRAGLDYLSVLENHFKALLQE